MEHSSMSRTSTISSWSASNVVVSTSPGPDRRPANELARTPARPGQGCCADRRGRGPRRSAMQDLADGALGTRGRSRGGVARRGGPVCSLSISRGAWSSVGGVRSAAAAPGSPWALAAGCRRGVATRADRRWRRRRWPETGHGLRPRAWPARRASGPADGRTAAACRCRSTEPSAGRLRTRCEDLGTSSLLSVSLSISSQHNVIQDVAVLDQHLPCLVVSRPR